MQFKSTTEIMREAADQMAFAQKLEELQAEAARLYPGFQIILTNDQASEHPELPLNADREFASLTGIEKIRHVMKEHGESMTLDQIGTAMAKKGELIDRAVLMTLLSRGKKQNIFGSFGRGIWGIQGQQISDGAEHL